MKKEKDNSKARLYSGQIVCSENYNNFTKEQRQFWQKCYKAFTQGKFYFKYANQEFIVPFRFADGSFDTVKTAKEFDERITQTKKQIVNEQDDRSILSGQSATTDSLAIGTM